jgi:VWFA-related protein
LRNSGGKFRQVLWLLAIGVPLMAGVAWPHAQTGTNGASAGTANGQQDQDLNIPDAPSTVQPAKPPTPPPSTEPPAQDAPTKAPSGQAPAQQPSTQATPDENANTAPQTATPTKPPLNIRTVPEGQATSEQSRNQLPSYQLPPVQVNQVLVPVTVTDEDGRLVARLTAKDFNILENGQKQKLNFFTSDPFALSAAVLIDLGMKDVDLQKVNRTYPALEGAFSEFDEVSVYTYSNTVGQQTGWGAVGPALSARLDQLREVRGENNGPPVVSGPAAAGGPMINNVPVDPGTPRPMAATQPARVMNDAILRAATDLAKRDSRRRKVIFVISDGREYRSEASYRDVLRVLLSNHIMVYAIWVGAPQVPGYGTLAKLHLPRFGYTNILPKYVNATTGGQALLGSTRSAIEDAYSQAMGNARNQYTLGYLTHAPATSTYRSFEVLVDRPSCRSSIRPCVNVEAPDGYYPAPPRQQSR